MRPWFRVPADFRETFVGIERITAELERTFWRLYALAKRPDPKLGHLVDRGLRPWSTRDLAYLCGRPRSTLQRHVPALLDHPGLLQQTLYTLFLPPVIETEQRFARTHATTAPTEPTTHRRARPVVENQLEFGEIAVENSPGDPRAGPEVAHPQAQGWPTAAGPPHPYVDEIETYVSSGSVLGNGHALNGPSDFQPLVPEQVTLDRARYLLAKLAWRSDVWRRVLTVDSDRAALARLASDHPSNLLSALEQAELQAVPVRNAAGWLQKTVPNYRVELAS